MPRVSLPADPASARKHGVQAVNRVGSTAFVENGFAHKICERDFGGGDHPRRLSRYTRKNPELLYWFFF